MKRLTIALALCMVAAGAFAGMPPKTELSLGGQLVDVQDGPNVWTFNADLLFPLGNGHVILGPAVAVGDNDDLNRLGVGLEWNLMGQKHGGLFIGAEGDYFVKDREGDRHTVLGKAGAKLNITQNAAVKIQASDVFDGVGKDTTDLGVAAFLIAKF